MVDCEKSKSEYNLQIYNKVPSKKYDAVVLAVSHDNFVSLDIKSLLNISGVIYDVKGFLNEISDDRL